MDEHINNSQQYHRQAKTMSPVVVFEEKQLETSISARFEWVAENHPTAVALKSSTAILRYAELNQRANQLARCLLEHKPEAQSPIALLFEHDITVFVCILAALKIGKSYAALNPKDPEERLRQQLETLGNPLLISDAQNNHAAHSLAHSGIKCLNFDEIRLSEKSDQNLAYVTPVDSVATILFTTGTTGAPKGVMRTHRQVLFRVWCDAKDCKLKVNDAISHQYLNNVAASVNDTYLALLCGATLCPFKVQEHTVEQWYAWLRDEQIRLLHPSIALLRQLLDTATNIGNLDLPYLDYVCLGGDKLPVADVVRFRTHFPDRCTLIHRFSASEVGVITKMVIDRKTQLPVDGLVPIGYPAPRKRVFIADEKGQELPVGEAGEICVQSCYLSPGYWKNTEQTDSRFIEDPSGTAARIYRTGDRGRVRQDGCLEHHGRMDFMVKILGYRVELEAIDRALVVMPGIRDALTVAREQSNKDPQLVAYIVYHSETTVPHDILGIRQCLAAQLPEHMIPAHFVALDCLPLTATGKPDRHALPPPDQQRSATMAPYAKPSTPFEEILCEIWGSVLEQNSVGINDTFVSLGGNSIQALSIAARVRQRFATHIPMAEFYKADTVAKMALLLLESLAANIAPNEINHESADG